MIRTETPFLSNVVQQPVQKDHKKPDVTVVHESQLYSQG